MQLLHIAQTVADPRIWTDVFKQALQEFGELQVVEKGGELKDEERAELVRHCDILLTGWNSAWIPDCIATDRGSLQYICHITGELARYIPVEIIDSSIPVTNWGDYPANSVAEGAITLLFATLKDLHHQISTIRDGGWRMDMHYHGGGLEGRNVGVYGCGVIGRRFIEMLAPFRCNTRVFDPYVEELPPGCERSETLEDLFDFADIAAIHAALTPETRHSVNADLLARLPRHGVVINTARGAIIDQEALFHEIQSGRLRAGLDVLDPDWLPEGHPARTWENLILTAHRVDQGWPDFNEPPRTLNAMQRICIDNLHRWMKNEPLRFVFDHNRYVLST